ncbi:hypothetical protein AK812_SmicGene21677 [Symbiodinium microadriaticum]|uniref:Uncharacterized protein n=1 Tax=Symbiodinium microadriaticum TaxID=2951 RepID=A0A1Q9DLU7_SYMMI|nr:hypothetical protein AK812_SmicGene21677 [Symbiodinium microadriaticum]
MGNYGVEDRAKPRHFTMAEKAADATKEKPSLRAPRSLIENESMMAKAYRYMDSAPVCRSVLCAGCAPTPSKLFSEELLFFLYK